MKRKRSLQTPLLLVAALCCQAQAITNASWIQCPDTPDLAAPVFRKTFVVEKKVTKAVCQASALGVYSLYLNGKRVGNDQLTPGWTDYRKEVMYLAYDLLLQRENPSWLFSVDQGATTVWERWDSYTSAEGFNKHPWNMNSFNHYAYGAIAEWFYAYILGIQPTAPGFAKVRLCPHVDPSGRITYAKGKTRTPRTTLSSANK